MICRHAWTDATTEIPRVSQPNAAAAMTLPACGLESTSKAKQRSRASVIPSHGGTSASKRTRQHRQSSRNTITLNTRPALNHSALTARLSRFPSFCNLDLALPHGIWSWSLDVPCPLRHSQPTTSRDRTLVPSPHSHHHTSGTRAFPAFVITAKASVDSDQHHPPFLPSPANASSTPPPPKNSISQL